MADYDPLLTMSALNMAVVSLHRITSSGDRLILDREYDSIINNLRMGEINADPELTSLYQEIVRVIHKGKLRDDIRATINKADSEKKHKSIKEIITGNVLKSFSTNPLKWLGKLAMSSASEYFSQQKETETLTQNNNDGQLRLKHDELDEYDELQRKLLGSSWSLLRQYQLPDSYRLTQNALMKFSSAMKEAEPSKRQRMMKYLEGDFAMYAPYWFYRAKAANEAGFSDEAGSYFAKFGEVWRPVLRKDPYRAEAMKYRIEGLMRSGVTQNNTGEILKCLSEMRANTELEDWANNIFAGMVYFTLGDKEKAIDCVMCNVDFGFECEVSGKVLEYMTTGKLPPENPDAIPVKSPEPPKVEPPKPEPLPEKLPEPQPKAQETPSTPKPQRPPMSDDEFDVDFVKLCESGDAKKVEDAIINGANVNARGNYGDTALMSAAREGHTETAELLLKHGADVNVKHTSGYTALWKAVFNGHTKTVELLLKHGADANDNADTTALMWAACSGNTEVAEALLKHGADINAKDNDGCTALMKVSRGGEVKTAELLLKYGADINVKNNKGKTALDLAKRGDNTEIVQLLRAHGAKEGLLGRLFG